MSEQRQISFERNGAMNTPVTYGFVLTLLVSAMLGCLYDAMVSEETQGKVAKGIGIALLLLLAAFAALVIFLFPTFFGQIILCAFLCIAPYAVIQRLKTFKLPKRPPPTPPPVAPAPKTEPVIVPSPVASRPKTEPVIVPSTALVPYEPKDEPTEGWMLCLVGIAAIAFCVFGIFMAVSTPSIGPANSAPIAHHAHHHLIETRPLSAAFLWVKSNEARSPGRP
jgi:hypothetical protein